jgi:aspartate aminotransferase-like enzyme
MTVITEPLLMVPGPVMLTDEVIQALVRPAVSHHDPAYNKILDECIEALAHLFDTSGMLAILPGSGRLGLEAAITSLIRPGDRTLHLVNGFFAGWITEIAQRAGAHVTILDAPWRHPFPAETLRQALRHSQRHDKRFALVTAVHSETATALLNPIAELGAVCREFGTLFLVDAISSFGCAPLSMERDHIDLCVTASQKGLCAPLGLSVVAAGPRALTELTQVGRKTAQTYALDLLRWTRFFAAQVPRPYPVIPSPHLVYALYASLQQIEAEGLSARVQRHERIAAATRKGIAALGLECFPRVPSPAVTASKVPEGMSSADIIRQLLDKHNIQIAAGMGDMADRMIRISHIGIQAMPEPQLRTLHALAGVLNDLGYGCDAETTRHAFESHYQAGSGPLAT